MAKRVMFRGELRYVSDNPKRCYHCGCRPQMARGRMTMFHKPDCPVDRTRDPATKKSEAETIYPTVDHGTFV